MLHLDPDFKTLSEEQRSLALEALYALTREASSTSRQSGRTQLEVIHAIGSTLLAIESSPHIGQDMDLPRLREAFLGVPESARKRLLQLFIISELVVDPLPQQLTDTVNAVAEALAVEEDLLTVCREYCQGAYAVAAQDLHRKGYLGDPQVVLKGSENMRVKKHLLDPFEVDEKDPELLDQWLQLEHCPPGSLGRVIWEYYRGRGFVFPGQPGSVNPTIAQHDWIHVLADYATTIEGELEVFSFIGSAIPDPKGFAFVVAIISLFETGRLESWGGGVLNADKGHLDLPGMPQRLADAILRGRLCNRDVMYGIDYFFYKDMPLQEVRQTLGMVPKSMEALEAGSVGVWDPEGITTYQREHGDPRYQPPLS